MGALCIQLRSHMLTDRARPHPRSKTRFGGGLLLPKYWLNTSAYVQNIMGRNAKCGGRLDEFFVGCGETPKKSVIVWSCSVRRSFYVIRFKMRTNLLFNFPNMASKRTTGTLIVRYRSKSCGFHLCIRASVGLCGRKSALIASQSTPCRWIPLTVDESHASTSKSLQIRRVG